MPRKQYQYTKRSKKRNTRVNIMDPPSNALMYRGPPTTPVEQHVVMDLLVDAPLTSTAGGVIADVIQDYPVSSPDWAGAISIFAEYRVLAMTVQFIPNQTGGNIAATLYAPLYLVWDAANTAALSSYAAASNYTICRQKSINQQFKLTHYMAGVEESEFVATTAPTVDYAFKFYATGLTASTNYGRTLTRWKCQFRGRL